MKKLDKKFDGVIYKVKDMSLVPPDQWVLFLPKDNAFAAILPAYRAKCVELGCDEEQIAAVDQMIQDVANWRLQHQSLCKNPDMMREERLA